MSSLINQTLAIVCPNSYEKDGYKCQGIVGVPCVSGIDYSQVCLVRIEIASDYIIGPCRSAAGRGHHGVFTRMNNDGNIACSFCGRSMSEPYNDSVFPAD